MMRQQIVSWRPINTLEEAGHGDALFWNPCDGLHILWMSAAGGADKVRAKYPQFTHWMPGPNGPNGENTSKH